MRRGNIDGGCGIKMVEGEVLCLIINLRFLSFFTLEGALSH